MGQAGNLTELVRWNLHFYTEKLFSSIYTEICRPFSLLIFSLLTETWEQIQTIPFDSRKTAAKHNDDYEHLSIRKAIEVEIATT